MPSKASSQPPKTVYSFPHFFRHVLRPFSNKSMVVPSEPTRIIVTPSDSTSLLRASSSKKSWEGKRKEKKGEGGRWWRRREAVERGRGKRGKGERKGRIKQAGKTEGKEIKAKTSTRAFVSPPLSRGLESQSSERTISSYGMPVFLCSCLKCLIFEPG
jgi:hypothetical protein